MTADTTTPNGDGPAESAKRSARHGSYRAGFAFGGVSFLATAVLGLVSTVITARLYGVRVIGQFALVSASVSALWILSTVKEQQALIREITGLQPRQPRVTQLFAVVFSFSAVLTATVAILDAIASWLVFRGPVHAPELVVPTFVSIAGYTLITNTGWNIDSIFSAFVAGRQIFWVRLHEVMSFILIAMSIGLVWRSVWGLVIATLGASLTALAHRVIAVRPFVRLRLTLREYRLGLQVLPELLRFGIRATPGTILQGISQQGGVWALGTVAPVVVVGAYSRAYTIPARLQQSAMRFGEVLYPTLVGRHSKGDGHGFDRALIDSIRYEMIGMLLIAAAVGGAAHAVLDVFGPGFALATPALALLAVYPALWSITQTQTQALWAINQPGLTSVIAVARMIVTVVLLILLTPRLGVAGPAIALLAGYLLVVLISGAALRPSLARPSRATWPLMERMSLVMAYSFGFLAARGAEQAVSWPAAVPAGLAAGVLTYVGVFVVSGGVNARDRERLRHTLDSARAWRRRRSARRAGAAQAAPAHDGHDQHAQAAPALDGHNQDAQPDTALPERVPS